MTVVAEPVTKPELDEAIKTVLTEIEENVVGNVTIADLLRESGLNQVYSKFGDGIEEGCALTAIATSAAERGLLR